MHKALQHAREEAERRVLQDKIDLEYERAEKRANRAIWWQRNGWRTVRKVLFWAIILIASIPTYGGAFVLVLVWDMVKAETKGK